MSSHSVSHSAWVRPSLYLLLTLLLFPPLPRHAPTLDGEMMYFSVLIGRYILPVGLNVAVGTWVGFGVGLGVGHSAILVPSSQSNGFFHPFVTVVLLQSVSRHSRVVYERDSSVAR